MAASLANASRGSETGGTINRILSNSRYLDNGGRQSFLGTSTARSFTLGKLEHAKLLQSALNGRMKGHTVPQQMSPPGGAPAYCWNDECSSGADDESYYGMSLLQLGEHGRPYCHNCIAENPTLVEPPHGTEDLTVAPESWDELSSIQLDTRHDFLTSQQQSVDSMVKYEPWDDAKHSESTEWRPNPDNGLDYDASGHTTLR